MVNSFNKKYGNDVMAEMMGFSDEKEFDKFYKQIKESLPSDLADKLDEVKDQIKTIDDLSIILNRLFNEYGDTLPYGFMILDYGGKDSVWIQATKELWNIIKPLSQNVAYEKLNMSEVMIEILKGNKKASDYDIKIKDLSIDENIVEPKNEDVSSEV